MTYKQIEASREVRLWIGQVLIPAIGVAGLVLAKPEVRQEAADKFRNVKRAFKKKFKKEKESR